MNNDAELDRKKKGKINFRLSFTQFCVPIILLTATHRQSTNWAQIPALSWFSYLMWN